ncbi:MAG TPA: disulfide bond formation protein B [Gammaproteobacteria bacterium]|nr:disulfide bond formation protein B [Gammaproteobacteria bacterium]
MLKTIDKITKSKWYWISFIAIGVLLESSALYYQYVLDYMPCVLCIHVRILVLAIIILALLALQLRHLTAALLSTHIAMTAVLASLFERSYQLLGVERGFIFGSCSMDSGLPSWFALDTWLPSLFKIWEACGYTPELLFGITMAEALIALSSVLLLVSGILSAALLINICIRKN